MTAPSWISLTRKYTRLITERESIPKLLGLTTLALLLGIGTTVISILLFVIPLFIITTETAFTALLLLGHLFYPSLVVGFGLGYRKIIRKLYNRRKPLDALLQTQLLATYMFSTFTFPFMLIYLLNNPVLTPRLPVLALTIGALFVVSIVSAYKIEYPRTAEEQLESMEASYELDRKFTETMETVEQSAKQKVPLLNK